MMKLGTILVGLLICASGAGAATGISLGIRTGMIDNYDQSNLSMATYNIDRMNLIGGQACIHTLPVLDLVVAADYSWRKRTYTIAGQDMEFKIRDLAVTASLVYPMEFEMISPYFGAGVGSHSISYEYVRPISLSLEANGVVIPETSTYFGYHGLIGARVEVPTLPFGFFMEVRLTRVNSPGDDISFNSWTGGVYMSFQ